MSKKSDTYYFDNFVECADCACQASRLLEEILEHYNPERLGEKIDQMHEIEHLADVKKHTMMEALMKSFITPIEREDIMSISQCIDDITDTLEDVVLRIYMCNIQSIRPEALRFAQLAIRCCETLQMAMKEFSNFKKSKALQLHLIEINRLEEEGDKLFLDSMRTLHTTLKDPVEIIAWRDIFDYLERCLDVCENTADIIETVIMKNT